MNAMAHPTKRQELLTEETVLRHRSLFCVEYDDCLEVAASGGWTSWSCESCPLARVLALPVERVGAPHDSSVAAAAAH